MQTLTIALVKRGRYRCTRVMNPSTDPAASPRADRATTALVTLVAAAIYVGLGQTTLHHNDGHRILHLLARGELDFGRHHLSLPWMHAFHEVFTAPLGLPAYRSVTLLNAHSSAAAVGLVFSAARISQLPRASALVAATLFGGCFPVLFFATLVEFHGVFLPWVTLSFWLGCRWNRDGGYGWAIAMGAVAGLATQLHSMGVFASGLFCLLHWAARRDRGRSAKLLESAAGVGAHVAVFLAGTALWQSLGWSVGAAVDALPRGAALADALIDRVPLTLWREFALPLCPLSLITAWALTRTEGRAAAVAVLLACAPYIALSALILGVSEHGAYLAALAAPMSLLATRVVPQKALIAITAAAWTCSLWLTWSHDTEGARYRDFAAGFQRLAGAEPALLLYCEDPVPGADAHVDELAALRLFAPSTESMRLEGLAAARPADAREQVVALAAALPAMQRRAKLLLGRCSYEALRDRYESGPVLLQAIERACRLEPRREIGFDGFELLAR
ncbi:MAG: hypothetical protein VXY92_13235 [Planctomycetota bacterium]|nr:hypothetical protein [Planctomycetota bacterium]